jgi:hypothetical protein
MRLHVLCTATHPELSNDAKTFCCVFAWLRRVSAGVPEDVNIQKRDNEDGSLLIIAKAAFDHIIESYPEQSDIIMTNLMFQFGLARDGQDSARGARPNQQSDDEAYARMRESIKRELKRSQDLAMCELTFAASSGQLEVVQQLVAKGICIDQADYDNRTTLHLAVAENQPTIVKLLLSKNASVDVVDRWGNTPLMDAFKHNNLPIAESLVASGATMPFNSFSAIKEAAETDQSKLAMMSLQAGVNINSADYDLRSVLHTTCAHGNLQAVESLLANGADINTKDRYVQSKPMCSTSVLEAYVGLRPGG